MFECSASIYSYVQVEVFCISFSREIPLKIPPKLVGPFKLLHTIRK